MGRGHRGKLKSPRKSTAEDRMIDQIDQLAEFEDFVKEVPKKLRDAIIRGASAEELYKEFSHIAAARAILIAMTEADSSKALAAIKDLQDRAHGKATEKKEIRHHLDKLSDEELEAMYKAETEELEDLESDQKTH